MAPTQISPHFTRAEFACRCGCGVDTVDVELLELLEAIRDRFGPVIINSGYRCVNHNRRAGGAQKSYHTIGKAADIRIKSTPLGEVAEWLNHSYPDCYGVIEYPDWLHVDVRSMPYRSKRHI